MNRVGLALAAVVFLVGLSGPWTPGEAQGTIPTEAQRRECERNGGYWDTAAGFCKVGAIVGEDLSHGRSGRFPAGGRVHARRFVVHAEEKLTAFVELESAIRACGELV